MAVEIHRVDYFHATVRDEPGGAYRLLAALASGGVNLLAFNAVPVGPNSTQLEIFPEDKALFQSVAGKAGLQVAGSDQALLIEGDDELGALAGVHRRLHEAGIEVYASNGIASGHRFGYLVFVRADQFQLAAEALGV